MAKARKTRPIIKLLSYPLKAGTKLVLRMSKHFVRSIMENTVWCFTFLIAFLAFLKQTSVSLAKKLSLDGFKSSLNKFRDGLKESFNHFKEMVSSLPDVLRSAKHAVQAAFAPVFGFLDMLASPIRSAGQTISQNFAFLVQDLMQDYDRLVEAERKYRDKFKSKVSTISMRVGSSFEGLKEKSSGFFGNLKENLNGFCGYVSDTCQSVFGYVSNTFQNVCVNVSNTFQNVCENVSTTFRGVYESSSKACKDVVGYVSYKFKDVCGYVSNKCRSFAALFNDKFSDAYDSASDRVNKVGKKISDNAGVVAVNLEGAREQVLISVKNLNETIKLGTFNLIEQGKSGFPETRRSVYRGTIQIKNGVVTYAIKAKLAISQVRLFQQISSSITRRMDRIHNATALDGAIVLGTVGIVAYLMYIIVDRHRRELYHRSLIINDKIREQCKSLVLQDPVLHKCMELFKSQLLLGLDPNTRAKSSVKCFNTYVQELPNGNETGQFLALDLGGTNFRVLLIMLNGRHFDMKSKIYVIPHNVMVGTGEMLFDHIASCLESFTKENRLGDKILPLGFTFSFPLMQIGLSKGILQKWTKGFNCSGVVGEDVVLLLQTALSKKDVSIDVVAVLNDTTGTLMSCAWKNHNCKVGVILGTGSNACYAEKVENVIGFESSPDRPYVLINTEWGAFGDNGELEFIRTSFDKEIDKFSINPGKQLHEKMISGMYLGELVRLLLIKFAKDKILFNGDISPKLQERYSFPTEYVSEIESDKKGVFKHCRSVLGKLFINNVSDQDCANVRYVCECISRRAAFLASAGIATIINKMGIASVTVGVDGSLYRFHPHFHDLMMEKIGDLISPNIHVNLMLSEDGSGRGAALVAAGIS